MIHPRYADRGALDSGLVVVRLSFGTAFEHVLLEVRILVDLIDRSLIPSILKLACKIIRSSDQ